ncbi:MAG: LptF/LptG family permease, partial [Proteobacteria bacterium]|nr:LptF/LptG family permease [Pseudomonadota bacterium]
TNMVVNFNADLFSIIMMMVYTLPRFLEFTIPMSVMISILLTFMRMSQENEIVALKGSGASLYTLLPPVFIFCLCGVVLTMWVTVFGVSWGRLSMKMKTVELARSSIDAALQERQFNSDLDDIMIYVSAVDMKTKELKDVFIEDRRTKGLVSISIAPEGRLIRFDDNQIYTIKLNNGVINQVDIEDNSVTHIRFGEYDINIDLGQMNQKNDSPVAKELKERNLTDLVRFIRSGHGNALELSAALMQLHEKFAVPFACITLGILAFSLGVQAASIRRASGFSLGIFFFLLYYFLLAVGWSFGETGDYPPAVGMWMPNVIMGSIAVFFLIRNAKEKPVVLPDFFQMAIDLVKRQQRKKA